MGGNRKFKGVIGIKIYKKDESFNFEEFCKTLENKRYIEIYNDEVMVIYYKKECGFWVDFTDSRYSNLEVYVRVGSFLERGYGIKSKN